MSSFGSPVVPGAMVSRNCRSGSPTGSKSLPGGATAIAAIRVPEPYTTATLAMLRERIEWSKTAVDTGEYVTDLIMELIRAYASIEVLLKCEAEDRRQQAIKRAWSGPVQTTKH